MSGKRSKKLRRMVENLTPPPPPMKKQRWWSRLWDRFHGIKRPRQEILAKIHERQRQRAGNIAKRSWRNFNRGKGGK